MQQTADLHTHTYYSDGALTPSALIEKAKSKGIGAISITDHDSILGVEEAIAKGKELGILVIPGIEISCSWGTRELHILGYCFDIHNSDFTRCLASFREERFIRAEKIVKKLNTMNIPLTMDMVLAKAGKGVICRPHIAFALLEQKFMVSFSEIFQKYIGDGCPAYEKKSDFSLEQTVELISNAGGLSFLAHPAKSITEKELVGIIKAGIDGIEVIHPSHSSELQKYYRGIAGQFFLLESGGSDYHGGLRADDKNFGKITTPMKTVEEMFLRLSSSNTLKQIPTTMIA